MTDIWRSLVAQRICWENGWNVLYHGPTALQDRNEHDLLADFQQEIPGYLNNHRIADKLLNLPLRRGEEEIPANLFLCYESLVDLGVLPKNELALQQAWIDDLRSATAQSLEPRVP